MERDKPTQRLSGGEPRESPGKPAAKARRKPKARASDGCVSCHKGADERLPRAMTQKIAVHERKDSHKELIRGSLSREDGCHEGRRSWQCYRCKEECGMDAKSCLKSIGELRSSAVVDIIDRILFRSRPDIQLEVQTAIEELERRGFQRPATSKEATGLCKSLQAVEAGSSSAVPFHLLLPAKETELETPGPIIEPVGPELRDSERDPNAAPSTRTTPMSGAPME